MDDLDRHLLNELLKDSRISYAELGRKYNVSRVCVRERINNLVEDGVIEKFTIVIDQEKLGKHLSVFFDIEVKPSSLYQIAEELIKEEPVTNIFLLTGSATIYMDALLEGHDDLEVFLREKLYSREDILKVSSKILLKRYTADQVIKIEK